MTFSQKHKDVRRDFKIAPKSTCAYQKLTRRGTPTETKLERSLTTIERLLRRFGMGCMSLTCQHAHKSNYCSRHRSNSSGSHCNHNNCCQHGQQKNGMIKDNLSGVVSVDMTEFCKWEECGKPEVCSPRSHRSVKSTSSVDDFNLQTTATSLFDDHNNDKHLHGDDNGSCSSKRNHLQRRSILNNDNSQNYSEIPRFILSYVYMAICGFANSLVVILAHDVFPLRSKYPPLPDLLLDNLPYKTWAFPASENYRKCATITVASETEL
ncbi:hypothetical protein HELRODRAFT_174877 [Helobdella robusta]|uniref:Uncharacterized protein n=1 Tax=Helobdella robusta TaxID=6412 RepID=T1F8K3_HELRO|nr:hypothetical protein HELRODRAFT_174877 [Helobdella robusta]ESO01324.1 hypothetical protein HELRODRAFT_174877 [Helobdella robusta]